MCYTLGMRLSDMKYTTYKKLVIRKLSKRSQLTWLSIAESMSHIIRDSWQAGHSVNGCVENLLSYIRMVTKWAIYCSITYRQDWCCCCLYWRISVCAKRSIKWKNKNMSSKANVIYCLLLVIIVIVSNTVNSYWLQTTVCCLDQKINNVNKTSKQ